MKYLVLIVSSLAMPSLAHAACNGAIIPSAPDGRYTDNGDETITDNQTGLMWKQCVEGISGAACDTGAAVTARYTDTAIPDSALSLALASNFAGHSDWRLPNLKELMSLVEVACYSPAINTNFFPATPYSDITLSATIDEVNYNRYTWVINFSNGVPQLLDNAAGFVRLVRDL